MTNADKVRNSKNEWKVTSPERFNHRKYRSFNKQIEYKNYTNHNWTISNCDETINSCQIEEIIVSPLEEMIKNPGVEYEITHNTCEQVRHFKWENNRLMFEFPSMGDSIIWSEILVGDFEKNFNPLTFKKCESLSDKVQQLSKDVESFGMYIQINPNNRVQVFLQDDYVAKNLKRLCDRGLIVNDISKTIIDDQIKYWIRVKEIRDLIDNQK
jgi:hypothetical protein